MGIVCARFFSDAGINVQDNKVIQALVEIKRAPRVGKTIQMPVRAFVESFLKPLSNALWEGKYTDEEVMGFLRDSPVDTDTKSFNVRLARNEVARRRNERRTTQAQSTVPRLLRSASREHNRMSPHQYVKETASAKNRR